MKGANWVAIVVLPMLILGVTFIIVMPWILKTRERFKAHETLRYLTDKGLTPPVELLAGLIEQPKARPARERDLRSSIFWISVAVGVSAIGASIAWVSDPEGHGWVIAPGLGAFPAAIGIGYFILWWVNRSQPRG